MPSPFPGMDPYIESSGYWGDFHGSMLSAIRAELNQRLPAGYAASIELFVWATEPETARKKHPVEPDVYVREEKRRLRKTATAAALAAPLTIVFPTGQRKRRKHLQIVDARTRRVVTVIELLSPGNKKAGNDREVYLTKRSEYLANRLNVVEIDLLRGGRRLPLGVAAPPIPDYYVLVCRSWEFPRAGVWSFSIRDPLPQIPVPVSSDLPDTLLPLRECVDRAYDEGRYAMALAYDEPLKPRLQQRDAAWARELVAPWLSGG
jgi:hypothetical protein